MRRMSSRGGAVYRHEMGVVGSIPFFAVDPEMYRGKPGEQGEYA
jgi:hypothetical protein